MGKRASMSQGKQQGCEGVLQRCQDKVTDTDHPAQDQDLLVRLGRCCQKQPVSCDVSHNHSSMIHKPLPPMYNLTPLPRRGNLFRSSTGKKLLSPSCSFCLSLYLQADQMTLVILHYNLPNDTWQFCLYRCVYEYTTYFLLVFQQLDNTVLIGFACVFPFVTKTVRWIDNSIVSVGIWNVNGLLIQ